MSNFKQISINALTFDNGYTVYFEAVSGLGTVFCHLSYKGEKEPISIFVANPDKGSGSCAYLTSEDFAETLYRISKNKPAS